MTIEATRPRLAYMNAQVRDVRRVTPRMVRVTFAGADLNEFVDAAPDQYVKVFFPVPGTRRPKLPPPPTADGMSWYRQYLNMPDDVRPPMRTYTVRASRPHVGELDIDFLLHDDAGPGSRWAESAKPGDEVALLGPHGLYEVPAGTSWQLLVGDESAVPAIAAICEQLPESATVTVFVEIADPTDEIPLERPGGEPVDVRWVLRGDAPVGEAVLAAVREARLPEGEPYAWISGEADLVKHVRRHLVRERGVDKRHITFTGYWRRGRSEEAAGREQLREYDRATAR
ncbi:siderophore-interacting protein [Saccharomonospora viridis]|jgi:NADPH-dependent ferric siderophore reductase|uniref:Side tail fiber protein n=1 Tax=Saccharomonospora viridis TaxID=1852 RepID=A0A837D836_9PSEU|nr:siderophore-interacting protein [Saccharomonospora viridis]KHF43963.1 side tail fiber protein [Saccharomonospora viridis]SFP89388.1 NADPH-dependent ferric siderophore reductase, contains FAD-binding and SIP domains [Saccharomonospora viridis]